MKPIFKKKSKGLAEGITLFCALFSVANILTHFWWVGEWVPANGLFGLLFTVGWIWLLTSIGLVGLAVSRWVKSAPEPTSK